MLRRPLLLLVGLGLAAFAVGAEGAPPAAGGTSKADGGTSKADVSPPALDDVEHMCALLTSCEGLPIPPSLVPRDFAACVKTLTTEMTSASAVNFSLTLRECGLRASSCSGLRTCALRGASAETCTGRGKASPAGFCDSEGRAISCWHEKIHAVRDCPRGGEQCAVREGEALCTLGACPADMKDSASPICSASGTRILRCEKGKLASLDCGAFGLKCVQAEGGPGCATVGKPCIAGSKRCEGNVAIGCFNGRETRVDCTTANLVCNGASGVSVGACTAPAPLEDAGRCDPAAPPRCDGATISYCGAGGRSRSYFCKSLGFARCTSDRSGARCVP